ncbi:unnamed protein product [Gordionus sp. m RMFG-2023]|uniref:oligosaccharyltransferase complex subunit ostc-B-like n=1 Tax=Gordionus sp. m RMFG-2023 TaxID=3053472 RepID=UPI0030E2703A
MESYYRLYFKFLECPNIKLKKPSWVRYPTPMMVFGCLIFFYFLITGGLIYDVINEPPSLGSMPDEFGRSKPIAFMAGRINGQFIMEGLAASFMFCLGGLGFVILDQSTHPIMPKLNRMMLMFMGIAFIVIPYIACRIFMNIKLPGYMR